jgi:hypothetical protein
MKRTVGISVLFILLALVSCEKETLEPRKNPRFSMAFVQDISDSGVQFVANVFDFGNEQILAYGFVYSGAAQPRIENSEVIQREGRPESRFEINATHSMSKGEKYRVAAFMRTNLGYIYSEAVEFESQGSEGFIFQRLDIPDPLYFGDTITVFGSELSRFEENYAVEVESVPAKIVSFGEEFFRFVLPEGIVFNEELSLEKMMNFSLTVADRTLSLIEPINFRKPIFNIAVEQRIDYVDTVRIEGDYLDSFGQFQVFYKKSDGLRIPLETVLNGRNSIGFLPSAVFDEARPKIEVLIRGESHPLENSFQLNLTEFVPGQIFFLNLDQIFSPRVTNINIFGPESHVALNGKGARLLGLTEKDFFYEGAELLDFAVPVKAGLQRNNEFYFENFGELSQNFISVNLIDPALPYVEVSDQFKIKALTTGARAVSTPGKGYFFLGREIYSLDLNSRMFSLVKSSQDQSISDLAGEFAILGGNEKIYSGTKDINGDLKLLEFDPLTESIIELPPPSGIAVLTIGVYGTENYLYYEGGFEGENESAVSISLERWRFDLTNRVWQKLENPSLPDADVNSKFFVFNYNDKKMLYFFPDKRGEESALFEFDSANETWTFIRSWDVLEFPISNELFVVGDEVYLFSEFGLESFNLLSFQTKAYFSLNNVGFLNNYNPLLSIGSAGKVFVYDAGDLIVEIDPEYLY